LCLIPAGREDRGVDIPLSDTRTLAVTRVAVELERHVAADGWDAPIRIFALVRTAGALERDATLRERLPPDVIAAAGADPDHLTAVEQEGLPEAETLHDLLGRLAWPDSVDGAAVVVERSVIPPEVEAQMPKDEQEALSWLQAHPERRDVRLAAAILRGGEHACALRARDHDADDQVAVGPELAPGLVAAVAETLNY
jgi:sulfur carrier protein ThiS